MSYYLYTETAFHHMGDMDFMRSLIKASAAVQAKGVKFQVLLDYDSFLSEQHSMYSEFKKGTFSLEEWCAIFEYTRSLGLDVIFMPMCTESFRLLKQPGIEIRYIDIHSVSFYDKDVLELIKTSKIPIILGIGGRYIHEVEDKILYFGNQLRVLMVGFQAFPSQIQDLRIAKIKWLTEKYSGLTIGFADHSSYETEYCISSNEWAYILGARFFEKHITVAEGADRWDFQSAMGVEKFLELKKRLDFLSFEVMKYSASELDVIEGKELIYRNRQKIAVAMNDLKLGHVLCDADLGLKMLDSTEGIVNLHVLEGKTLIKDVVKGEKVTLEITKV